MTFCNWRVKAGIVLTVAILLSTVAVAQLPTGTILGLVRDATGSAVPGAQVNATETETTQSRTVMTNDDGSFRLSALPVGNYLIHVEHSGFKTVERRGITLTVSEDAVVNFTLEIGNIEQKIEVTAEAAIVNTTNSSLGGLVNEEKVTDLPLNGRNYADLTLLQAGVTQARTLASTGFTGGAVFSSNGAPLRSNSYLLDGASMVSGMGLNASSASGSTLGVEGIREYKVITNSVSAEYGMTMGSQTVIVSKSGTNSFHGSMFEYLRNSSLDARNFFDTGYLTGGPRLPPYKRNNFGGSLGGPIRKDKTFFFLTYEGLIQRFGQTLPLAQVPASSCHGNAGAVITLAACPQLGAPSATISTVSAPLLALYPLPNVPGTNNYQRTFTQPTKEHYGQTRVDHTFSASDSTFARYTIDDAYQSTGLQVAPFTTDLSSRNQFLTLSETHIFTSTLLNTARFSLSRTLLNVGSAGVTDPQFQFNPPYGMGTVAIAGYVSLGTNSQSPTQFAQNIFAMSDDIFYQHSKHSLKFGLLFNHFQQNIMSGNFIKPSFTFTSLATLMTGQMSALNVVIPKSDLTLHRYYRYDTIGAYAQDDYRVFSRLTLNLGLRYEIATVPTETNGQVSGMPNPATDVNYTLGPLFKNPSLLNFSPRVGFAWDIKGDGKTAVRAGFGLLYDLATLGSALQQGGFGNPSFGTQIRVANPPALTLPLTPPSGTAARTAYTVAYNLKQPEMYQYNLTVERQLPWSSALTISYAGSRGLHLIQFYDLDPVISQLVAGKIFWPVNSPRINTNWGNLLSLNTTGDSSYNSLQIGLTKRLSQGLQLQIADTYSKLIDDNQGQTGSDGGNGGTPFVIDSLHPFYDRGLAQFDIHQNFRLNAIYRFPTGDLQGISKALLGGWWTSGILSLQTGYPFSPIISGSWTGANPGGLTGVDRPDVLSGRTNSNITRGTSSGCTGYAAGKPLGTAALYFDPCAFSLPVNPTTGVIQLGWSGTAARNSLIGPGFANLDFSFVKDTPLKWLGENGAVQFRAETFNMLNHANFALPVATVFTGSISNPNPTGTAGQIQSTVAPSRQIQFALKILF